MPARYARILKLVVDGETERVVGCHIVGPDAGEIIQLVGIAVKMKATKFDFDAVVAVHPTAAKKAGLLVVMVEARNPQETENAFTVFAKERVQAVIVCSDGLFFEQQQRPRRALFDHLVRAAEQREWDGEAEHLGGLEIDDQLDCRGLLDRYTRNGKSRLGGL